jgi:short-subunit dehydrogenase
MAMTTHPTALITGGSRGIGLALARELARRGYGLVLTSRDPETLARAAADLEGRGTRRVVTRTQDLSAEAGPEALHAWLAERGIAVDMLVNNAGVGIYAPFSETGPRHLADMLRLNVLALTALTRLLLPSMLSRGHGRILNVASLAAYLPGSPGWAAYAASKSYVLAFNRGLAMELRGTGVTTTALCPGPTATDFERDSGAVRTRLYRWLPKPPVDAVARAGVRAALAGRVAVVPGLLNKALALGGELPPRRIALGVASGLMERAR